MPTYDYRCDACGHEFSRVQRFEDEPVGQCPNCGARPRRLLSRPAIVFKGSGWYVTDYRRAKDGAAPAADGEQPAKSGEAPADGSAPKEKVDSTKTKKDSATKDSAKKENAAKSEDAAS